MLLLLQDYSRAQQLTLWAFGSSMAGGDLVALNNNPFSPDVRVSSCAVLALLRLQLAGVPCRAAAMLAVPWLDTPFLGCFILALVSGDALHPYRRLIIPQLLPNPAILDCLRRELHQGGSQQPACPIRHRAWRLPQTQLGCRALLACRPRTGRPAPGCR